jgi:hypothetical protein
MMASPRNDNDRSTRVERHSRRLGPGDRVHDERGHRYVVVATTDREPTPWSPPPKEQKVQVSPETPDAPLRKGHWYHRSRFRTGPS